MDNTKIFIDTDTEITFIIEKILNARTQKVTLVIPDRASVLTSITGLKLIKRIVDKSNKLLIIVTLDEQGADLARKAELFVVARVGEINEKVWEVIQRAKFEVMKKSRSHYMPETIEEQFEENHSSFLSNMNKDVPVNKDISEDESINNDTEEEIAPDGELQDYANENYEENENNDKVEVEDDFPLVRINLSDELQNDSPLPTNVKVLHDDVVQESEVEYDRYEEKENSQRGNLINRFKTRNKEDMENIPRRKRASNQDGISNLNFSFGKDISDEKKN